LCDEAKFNFRLVVDDAHGFGTLGKTGAGAGEEQGVQDDIDVYFQLLQNQWLTLVLLLQLTKTLSTI
jgi:glycine C-acetyltransferase